MPKDVYRWEEGGALVHHCPICATPLSNDMCRSRCLGKHVEWCRRYHTQLFRKNYSSTCAPCGHAEDAQHKRHKNITELLQQLKQIQTEQLPKTPVKVLRTVTSSPSPSPLSKRDRKAAKKTAKLKNMPKVFTTADVESVAKVLHPHDSDKDEVEEERRLLDDPDIKLNLYFFKGTSNTRESRRLHLKPKSKGEQILAGIDEDKLATLLLNLGVPKTDSVSTSGERQLVERIRFAVYDDLVHMAKEHEQLMMRKAGFWRWVSRKAYDRLVQNGRLWDDASDSSESASRKDSVVGDTEDLENEVADGKPLQDLKTSVPKTPTNTARTRSGENALPTSSSIDDGWTQVGKTTVKRKTEMAIMSIKMSGNKGLAKLQVKPKGMFGALGLADEAFAA